MRISQVVRRGASEYEKKSQRIDFELLSPEHELVTANPDITLNYANLDLPEAVEEGYFVGAHSVRPQPTTEERARAARPYALGTFNRRGIRRMIERTIPRIHRTREDVEWLLLDAPPTPEDFAQFDAWVDPAIEDDDYDGFVAEALVAGKIVVASRTPINVKRLEKGRTGILVPPGDANELTHAILAALFKPEVAQQKIEAARQTISKFHPRQRLRALTQLLATAKQ
ncbi:MAG TPA: glycosyltransferase [Thermoanaerobaculia bacterium]